MASQPADLERFIASTPGLEDLIDDVIEHGMPHFPHAAVSIDAVVDPESGREAAILRFCSDLDADQALAALHAFDAAWWLDNCARAGRALIVDVGFVPGATDV